MRFNGTVRRQLTGTVTAMAAMAALTASQAPGFGDAVAASREERSAAGPDDVVWTEVPGDDSYHTELPPLESPEPPAPLKPPQAGEKPPPVVARASSEAGIPATVLAAYRNAESALRRSDPGCGLPWRLLAAIGKVESGQAAGGRVDARGTTLTPILGPALDGVGFALIRDTDNGVYDGDRTYDRAVGPMQFIPSTWANWAKDGNGDGRKDPNNIYDAALAAGHYLCAGGRDLRFRADLDRAILSYNRSDAYLRTVLSWLEFYRKGTHPVADGQGPLPVSPGPGGTNPPKAPVGSGAPNGPGKGDGIVIGPQPTRPPSPTPTPGPTAPGSPSPSPDPTDPGPDPAPTPGPTDPTPGPSPDPTDPGPTDPGPADPAPTDPGPTDPGPTPDPTEPAPGPSPDPGTTDPGCPSGVPAPPEPSTAAGSRAGEDGEDGPCAPGDGSAG